MKHKRNMAIRLVQLFAAALILTVGGCGIYTFSGTSLQSDIKSIYVENIENRAMQINPALSNMFTQALQDKYRRLTKLQMVENDADLEVTGHIVSYEVTPTAVTADEVASRNRLTITVKIFYKNNKYPDEAFPEGRSFAAYQDYDSTVSLDAVQDALCQQIVETLVEDIFNATVAEWR
ncbi:MAG: LptE family protein [Bacteroidales bacterium]|nr:LptE family protein [Bacteroidales bacterium]